MRNWILYICIIISVAVGFFFLGRYHQPDQVKTSKTSLATTTPANIPSIASYVNDNSRVLNVDAETSLTKKLVAFAESGDNEIAVLTVKTLNGLSVEEFAIQVTQRWNGADNNILLVIATDERKVRIEVGRNVFITDEEAGQILDDAIVPRLRRDDFAGAINDGVDAIIKLVKSK